jgi:exonuclease SbcC
MIPRLRFRSALHEHAEPAQRVRGIAELPPDSPDLAHLLSADPAAEVRAAAAARCADPAALAAAWESELDATVRAAVGAALSGALAVADGNAAGAILDANQCTDAIRLDVVRLAQDPLRRALAIATLRDEEALVALALSADHAETRKAAASRVHSTAGLRRLADEAGDKDRGVARHARARLDAMADRLAADTQGDVILVQIEALAQNPGPIVTAVVDLDRRWQALDLQGDALRVARWEAARRTLQARFEREHDEQRARVLFQRRLSEWTQKLAAPLTTDSQAGLAAELASLREEAQARGDDAVLARLQLADEYLTQGRRDLEASADAEALVAEAERLAAGTSIDNATLPQRWQALGRATRTPALTQRFEAALIEVEQRRLTQIRAAQLQSSATKQQIHDLLHAAEQALAAGQLAAARAAADEIRTHKAAAGPLPKPTQQRLSRVVQQLSDLERWESFGQHNARVQLCERAEALATQPLDPPKLAIEVQKLRAEWKVLDQQHAGVPKSLWERFDAACERAYGPAARHFAEQAAQRKQARRQREEFIAAAAAQVPTLLGEPRDVRGIERWVRETERKWREGELGSVEPGAWKKLDARLKSALIPLRDALALARDQAKGGRQALIAEALALGDKATQGGALTQVKALQARWQEEAKAMPLAQRDERALWEQFRTACDAVFSARMEKRKEEDKQKHEKYRALEATCVAIEQLAQSTDQDDAATRRGLRELAEQWKARGAEARDVPAGLESRFRQAKAVVDATLAARARGREAAVWQALSAKERLCEDLDALVQRTADPADAAARTTAAQARWTALPALAADREKKLGSRRDAALRALADAHAAEALRGEIERGTQARRALLLELEMLLGIESPAELQSQRLALQVKQLRDRFKGEPSSGAGTAAEKLVDWCALPGVADARDRQRSERVFEAVERAR